jgi:hypothetical protein
MKYILSHVDLLIYYWPVGRYALNLLEGGVQPFNSPGFNVHLCPSQRHLCLTKLQLLFHFLFAVLIRFDICLQVWHTRDELSLYTAPTRRSGSTIADVAKVGFSVRLLCDLMKSRPITSLAASSGRGAS